MREREKLREAFHSHTVTQRHMETQRERRHTVRCNDAHPDRHTGRQAPGGTEAEQVSWRHPAQTRKGGLITETSQALSLPLQLWGFQSLLGILPRAERRSPVFRTLGKYRQGVTLKNWIFSLSRSFPYGFPIFW